VDAVSIAHHQIADMRVIRPSGVQAASMVATLLPCFYNSARISPMQEAWYALPNDVRAFKEDRIRKRPKKKATRKHNVALATNAEAVIVVRQ
jgi:hypothetical protein